MRQTDALANVGQESIHHRSDGSVHHNRSWPLMVRQLLQQCTKLKYANDVMKSHLGRAIWHEDVGAAFVSKGISDGPGTVREKFAFRPMVLAGAFIGNSLNICRSVQWIMY